jgi:hypothetical protein
LRDAEKDDERLKTFDSQMDLWNKLLASNQVKVTQSGSHDLPETEKYLMVKKRRTCTHIA